MVILSVEVRNGTSFLCHCICVAAGKLPSMVQFRDITSPSINIVPDTASTFASGTTDDEGVLFSTLLYWVRKTYQKRSNSPRKSWNQLAT